MKDPSGARARAAVRPRPVRARRFSRQPAQRRVETIAGKFYVVNGEKKWITNGVFADYFTVAVRTGGPGMGGLSLLLLERGMAGLETKQMKCMGVWPSGTTYITMEDVRVPVENLIGEENGGFRIIMNNFNHERWALCVQASRFARVCLEESFKYALKRKTFGKPLMEHPVIRWKIAEMARQVEATHAQLENLTYQMCTMSKKQANEVLAGPIALMKAQTTKTFEYCARCARRARGATYHAADGRRLRRQREGGPQGSGCARRRSQRGARCAASRRREAAQIFGGASYVRGGQGEKVERLYREARAPHREQPTPRTLPHARRLRRRGAGARVRHPGRQRGDHAGPRGQAGDEGDAEGEALSSAAARRRAGGLQLLLIAAAGHRGCAGGRVSAPRRLVPPQRRFYP